jgi:Zn-dependent protease
MMLLEPNRTPYDLSFRLFGTPVRIAPWFWLVSVIFGWRYVTDPNGGPVYLLFWVACVFVSILLHEFGHVWAGKAFGSDGSIVLYSFGGLAVGSNDLRQRWQRIVVSLAGPGIQLALYGALRLAEYRMGEKAWDTMPILAQNFLGMLMEVNLLWPLFNLVPVWPLDGGMVCREVSLSLSRPHGLQISLRISVGVALFLAIHAIAARFGEFRIPHLPTGMYIALLFGALAFESYQLLQQSRFMHYEPPDDRLPWE